MTLRGTEGLSNHHDAIWFRAGELSALQDKDVPLSYPDIDDHDDLAQRMEEDPQIIFKPNSKKVYFHRRGTIVGRRPKKCYSLMIPQDRDRRSLMPVELGISEFARTVKTYASAKADEEVLESGRDPETLDDSEIEDLLNQHPSPSKKLEGQEPGTNKTTVLEQMYLIVTDNSFYRAGDVMPFELTGEIDDCQVLNSEKTRHEALLVITMRTGFIYCINLGKQSAEATITRSLELGSKGPWCVRKHQQNEQLMAFNGKQGVCRFFEVKECQFEAVNNLTIDDSIILDCTFFPSDSNTHFFLFVATLQSGRLVYYCIEWDSIEPKMKKVHYLTYLTGNTFETCMPLGDKKIIVSFHGILEVVSANQLMSGETNFNEVKVPKLQGICDNFHAPRLLEILKREDDEEFSRFEYCLVVGTTSGHINACLVDSENRIVVYSMTRFKGLKSLCSKDERAELHRDYPLIVVSYGRTIEIFIDIKEVKPLSQVGLAPSFSGLTFKHTMDSSLEGATQIALISPIKRSGRHDSELWLTCPTSITNLQTSGATRKIYHICELQQIPFFRNFRFYQMEALHPEFESRLTSDLGTFGQQAYLIFGSDRMSFGSGPSALCFALDLSTAEPQLIEIDDLMVRTNDAFFDVFLTNRFIVQVSRSSIYLQSLMFTMNEEPKVLTPGWQIEGVAHYEQSVLIWNIEEKKLRYIEDINEITGMDDFRTVNLSESDIDQVKEGRFECQIVRGSGDNVIIYMAGNRQLVRISLSLSCPAVFRTVRSGHVKSMVSLKNWLCFVCDANEIVAINHSSNSSQSVDLDLQSRDIELRRVNGDTCLVFSTQEVVIFTLSDTEGWKQRSYTVNLPLEVGFRETIMDAQVDEINNKLFLRRLNGLHVYDMSFYSSNRSKYILRSTRDIHKKFIFIEKINRMLVINFDSRKWDCIKLTNGKTLSLDPSVLHEEGMSLIDVTEIPSKGKSIALILMFEKQIKLVQLIPQRGKIIVKQIGKMHFEHLLLPFTAVQPDGCFYIISADHNEDFTILDKATILAVEVTQEGLKIVHELMFLVRNVRAILEFKLHGPDIMFSVASHNMVFLFKDIRKSMLRNEINIVPLDLEPDLYLMRLYSLNDDVLVAVAQFGDPLLQETNLLLYHRSHTDRPKHRIKPPYSQQYDIFELVAHHNLIELDQSYNVPPVLDREESASEDDGMYEMDGFDAFEGPERFTVTDVDRATNANWPYERTTLGFYVKDVAYDPIKQEFLVLQTNDTVVIYGVDTRFSWSWMEDADRADLDDRRRWLRSRSSITGRATAWWHPNFLPRD